MTFLICYTYVHPYFKVFNLTIQNFKSKMANKSNSSSVSVDHRKYKNYSVVSRSNSFSSCSNDSVAYSDNGVQTRFGKRTLVNNSAVPHKRSRNSSGSSISSNMSCVSDKDLKSSKMISPPLNAFEMKNCVSNKTGVSRLKYSKINANSGELKEETIINKEVSCSGKSLVILPKQHNLRGKITKKGCACCPSTCTTVVLRRYKKYVKTSEEETVISSTKVKTYVQKSSSSNTEAREHSYMPSSESKPRKRRSELEKLYASLHEIEWAKNFSPDNILSQINVRQAASHSVFGRSPPNNTKNVSFKICNKKQKDLNPFDCVVDPSHNFSSGSVKSDISMEECAGSSSEANLSKELLSDCDTGEKTIDLQTKPMGTSDMYHCTQNYKTCNSQSSVNITTCSMSHIKEISINSRESVRHTESLISENGADYSDDAQLSYTSDESSSAVSTSIVNIQSKHLLDFDYKRKHARDFSETDVTEYSSAPTFFDIAEEGIRTIDACFREVGAEVVVSTCYDEDSSLPLLTSIKENKVSGKTISNDDPPVLEPYVDVTFATSSNCSEVNKSKKTTENNKTNQDTGCHKTKTNDVCHSTKKLNSQSNSRDFKTINNRSSSEKKKRLSQNINLLSINFGKKIMKKYIKQSRSRSRLKSEPTDKVCVSIKTNSDSRQSVPTSPSVKSCVSVEKNINPYIHQQQSILCTSYPKPVELFCTSPNAKTKVIFKSALKEQYSSNKSESTVVLQSAQTGSCFFQNGKIVKYCNTSKRSSCIPESGTSDTKLPVISSTIVSTTIERESSSNKEQQISRLPLTLGYSCHYKAIKVNRSYNYTNIILMVTRGKSMFLTLEVLSELKDALNRTNNDSSCQVLIVNGVGDSFCLGLDLKPLVGPRKKIASTEMAVAIKELIEALSEFKKPLAAVVNGPAFGLGMTLLNHADFTIASDKATFCMPYSYLGYMPEGGATLTLPQIVGSTVAMDLLLRGKTLTAREARNVGLISEVLEAKRLPHELVSRVRMLAENPLSALETTKALLKMQLHINLRLVLENEVKLLPRMWLTRTCQDALRRALESGILSD